MFSLLHGQTVEANPLQDDLVFFQVFTRQKTIFRCVVTSSRHSYRNTVSVRPREDPQSRRPSFDKVQASAMITCLFLFLRPLTPVSADPWRPLECNEIHAAHQSTKWTPSEANFHLNSSSFLAIIQNCFTSGFLVAEELFFYLYATQLLGFRRSLEKWVLSRDNISKIQLTSADGKCKLFSFSTCFSSSFLF